MSGEPDLRPGRCVFPSRWHLFGLDSFLQDESARRSGCKVPQKHNFADGCCVFLLSEHKSVCGAVALCSVMQEAQTAALNVSKCVFVRRRRKKMAPALVNRLKETASLKSTNKICRQLIYHLTPHSKWTRQSVPRRKSQACLKSTLKKKLSGDVVNLSGIPLSGRDVHRVAFYLQGSGDAVSAVDLSFTELQDDSLRLLLPPLSLLPKLSILAVNGNRLTAAVLKDLTDAVKDPRRFPSLAWVDLGNNVDIFTVPQPLLVALRRRFGLRSSLPTIYEYGGGCAPNVETSVEEPTLCEEADVEEEDREEEEEDRLELRAWGVGDRSAAKNVPLHFCGR
ncbi:leucine rich repeat containing 75Bb isoform X2 [Betta splendens]|uniref:Leucine rich repeat containing 75Bb isoform X2 n=1 Tax=Betta splendens TaxID=158456 RepID=A0A9W2Y658_BETSP|nr:leucine rich repeat containing 75Bb isoform X2 [Betta splendens]